MLALGPIQHSTRPAPLLPRLPSDADCQPEFRTNSLHARPPALVSDAIPIPVAPVSS
jgi:hypothetical protein